MKKLISVLVVLSALVASPAFADSAKIGIVSLEQLLQNSKLAVSLNADLRKQFQPRQAAINDAQRKLQDEVDQLTFNSYNMTADDRTKLAATVDSDKNNLTTMVTAFQKDFATAQQAANNQFLKKLSDVIRKIGQDEKYDIIERGANIFYINNSIDITKEVLDKLNAAS